jgi:DNA-binding MarR family transcriptional regulator
LPKKPIPQHDHPDAMPIPSKAEPDAVWARVFRLLADLDQLHVQIQRVLDVLPSEARALLAVWNADGLSAGELAKRVKLTNAAITTLIDRLEHRNLVMRTRNKANKRYVIVTATPLAHERLAMIGSRLQERYQHAADTATRRARRIEQGIEPLRDLLDESITTLRLTPIEVFPVSLDNLPIQAFQTTDDD